MNYVGIDVSKAKLDVFIRPSKEHFIISNTKSDIESIIPKLQEINPERIVLESTGSYEVLSLELLSNAGLKVSLVNPFYVKSFAKSGGLKAKTDKLDSSVIAHYGEVHNPNLYVSRSQEEKTLENLLTRRNQLVANRVQETNRLKKLGEEVDSSISEHIEWLDNKIKEIDDILDNRLELNQELKKKDELLTSVPGIGKVLSKTLLLELPELGSISNKKISSLVGVVPFNRDSGKYRGQMSIFGGREPVRSCLFMPTLVMIRYNPVIKEFYDRLITKGKKPKVAIVACMNKLLHILNSIIKNGKAWDKDFFKKKAIVLT